MNETIETLCKIIDLQTELIKRQDEALRQANLIISDEKTKEIIEDLKEELRR